MATLADFRAALPELEGVDDFKAVDLIAKRTGVNAAALAADLGIERPTLGGEFKKGLSRAVDQLQGTAYAGVGLLGDVVGADSVRDWGLRGFQRNADEARARAAAVPSIADIDGVGNGAMYFAGALGEVVPQMIPSLGVAGLGAKLAGSAAAKEAAKLGLGAAAKKAAVDAAVGRGALAAGAGYGIGQETSGIYGDIYQRTGQHEPLTALVHGVPAGLVEGLAERTMLKGWMEGARKGGRIAHAAKVGGKSGLTEGFLEEGPQSILEQAALNAVDPTIGYDPMDVADSVAKGFIGSGTFGTAAGLTAPSVNEKGQRRTATEIAGDAIADAGGLAGSAAGWVRNKFQGKADNKALGSIEEALSKKLDPVALFRNGLSKAEQERFANDDTGAAALMQGRGMEAAQQVLQNPREYSDQMRNAAAQFSQGAMDLVSFNRAVESEARRGERGAIIDALTGKGKKSLQLTEEGRQAKDLATLWRQSEGRKYGPLFEDASDDAGFGSAQHLTTALMHWVRSGYEAGFPKQLVEALGDKSGEVVSSMASILDKQGLLSQTARERTSKMVENMNGLAKQQQLDHARVESHLKPLAQADWSIGMTRGIVAKLRRLRGAVGERSRAALEEHFNDVDGLLEHFGVADAAAYRNKQQGFKLPAKGNGGGGDLMTDEEGNVIDADSGEMVDGEVDESADINESDEADDVKRYGSGYGDVGAGAEASQIIGSKTVDGTPLPFNAADEAHVEKLGKLVGAYENDPGSFARAVGVWRMAKESAQDKASLTEMEDELLSLYAGRLTDDGEHGDLVSRFNNLQGGLGDLGISERQRGALLGMIDRQFKYVEVHKADSGDWAHKIPKEKVHKFRSEYVRNRRRDKSKETPENGYLYLERKFGEKLSEFPVHTMALIKHHNEAARRGEEVTNRSPDHGQGAKQRLDVLLASLGDLIGSDSSFTGRIGVREGDTVRWLKDKGAADREFKLTSTNPATDPVMRGKDVVAAAQLPGELKLGWRPPMTVADAMATARAELRNESTKSKWEVRYAETLGGKMDELKRLAKELSRQADWLSKEAKKLVAEAKAYEAEGNDSLSDLKMRQAEAADAQASEMALKAAELEDVVKSRFSPTAKKRVVNKPLVLKTYTELRNSYTDHEQSNKGGDKSTWRYIVPSEAPDELQTGIRREDPKGDGPLHRTPDGALAGLGDDALGAGYAGNARGGAGKHSEPRNRSRVEARAKTQRELTALDTLETAKEWAARTLHKGLDELLTKIEAMTKPQLDALSTALFGKTFTPTVPSVRTETRPGAPRLSGDRAADIERPVRVADKMVIDGEHQGLPETRAGLIGMVDMENKKVGAVAAERLGKLYFNGDAGKARMTLARLVHSADRIASKIDARKTSLDKDDGAGRAGANSLAGSRQAQEAAAGRGRRADAGAQEAGVAAQPAVASDAVPGSAGAGGQGRARVVLPNRTRHTPKDQVKSDKANKFIGRGSAKSSTADYAEAWGDRANMGEYRATDTVFVSAEGVRAGRVPHDKAELKRATDAGATIITDDKANREDRAHNVGEREVAAQLLASGYKEVEPGVWKPAAKFSKVVTLDDKRWERTSARALDLANSLSEEDYNTLQNDVLSLEGSKSLIPARLKGDFREWLRDYHPVEREEMMAHENVRDTERKYLEELAENAEGYEKALAENILAGGGLKSAFNSQAEPAKPNTSAADRRAARQAAIDYVTRTLGDSVKLAFRRKLGGISGRWTPRKTKNLIEISLHGDILGTAFHESFHEFLQQLQGAGATKAHEVILRAAQNPLVRRKVERLLEGHPEAQAQVRNDPEEAAAYMYQFWLAGPLRNKLGPETKTIFQKIKQLLREVAGLVSDTIREQNRAAKRAEGDLITTRDILEAFAGGAVADQTTRAAVMAEFQRNAELREAANRQIGATMDAVYDKMAKVAFSAEAVLDRTKDKELVRIARLFNQKAGEAMLTFNYGENGERTGRGSYFDGVRAESDKRLNRLKNILSQYDPEDLEMARKARSEGRVSTDPVAKEINDKLDAYYADMARYIQESDIRRLDEATKKWVPVEFIKKNYLTRVADVQYLMEHGDEFVADLIKHHKDHLERIVKETKDGDSANAMRRGSALDLKLAERARLLLETGQKLAAGEQVDPATVEALKQPDVEITVEDVAKAILLRLMNGGTLDNQETDSNLGMTPAASAVNRRQLSWLDMKVFDKYMSKDLVNILTTYTRSMIKRGEYQKRFGYNGDKIADAVEAGYINAFDDKTLNPKGKGDLLKRAQAQHAKELAEWLTGDRKTARPDLMTVAMRLNAADVGDAAHSEALAGVIERMKEPIRAIRAMEGTLGSDITPQRRAMNSWLVTYTNLRTLPLMLFTNFQDVNGIVINGGTMKDAWDAFVSGVKGVKDSWTSNGTPDRAMRRAEAWGTVDAGTTMDAIGQAYGSVYMTGRAKKISDAFFKVVGAEGWNRGIRAAATQIAENMLVDWAQHGVDMKDPAVKARVERLYGPGATTASITLDPDGNLDISDARNRAAVNRWVLDAVPAPNAAHRPAWGSDPHFSLFMHLKNYTFTWHRTILLSAMDAAAKGDFRPATVAALGYLPIAIAAGAIKEMLIPGDEPAWMKRGMAGYLEYGFQQAGILGVPQMVLGDLLEGDVARLLGPVFDQAQNMATVPFGEAEIASLGPLELGWRDHTLGKEIASAAPGGAILRRMMPNGI